MAVNDSILNMHTKQELLVHYNSNKIYLIVLCSYLKIRENLTLKEYISYVLKCSSVNKMFYEHEQ